MEGDAPATPSTPPPPPPPHSYPFSGFVPPPSLPLPPGFRPLSDAQSSAFYQAGWWRPPPLVPSHYPPNGFNGAQNPFPYPAAILSPAAGMGGRPPATGWMQSSVSASQPPNPTSPGRRPTSRTPAPQPVNPRSLGRKPTSKTPDAQEVSKTHQHLSTQEKEKAKTQGEGGTSVWIEPEAPSIADSHADGKQGIRHLGRSSHSQNISSAQCHNISVVKDAHDTTIGDIGYAKSREFTSSKRNELEISAVADHQEKEKRDPKCHRHQSTQEKEKQMAYIRRQKSKEVASSVRDEPEAPLLKDFQDGVRAQMQPSPGKAKEKRQLDQTTTTEDVANTSQRREIRERKLQKLISSEKNDIEAGSMPQNPLKDSACTVFGEVDNTAALPITHNPDDSSSLQSSTMNWASTFDDVSSTGVGYRATGEMVKVGNYTVHQKHSTTMEAIIKKYGDIAKDCGTTSSMLRSCAVRGVCEVVEGLQIPLDQLSHDNLKAYSRFVKEVLVMGLSVKWLEERLDEVSDTIDSIYEYKHLRDTRKANTEKMKDLEKEVGLKETENGKCESEVENLQCVFEAATLEVKKKKRAINDVKSRCRAIPRRLLGGIL